MVFNTTVAVTIGQKGETVCRAGDWLDVAKFFLFNFVIHAFTVVHAPGAKTLRSIHVSLTAILLPFSGAYRAFQAMAFYRWAREDDLHVALRAQALCTPVPSEHHPTGHVLFPALNVIEVHGQNCVPPLGFLEWTGIKNPALRPHYQLSRVPWWFAVTPLKQPSSMCPVMQAGAKLKPTLPQEHNPMSETKLSCDYNLMKVFAAILQILSGLFQLFQVRGMQLQRYGYSAYSLTVIPYVLMSLVNLLACVCIPQYPMMYLVHYGGKKRPITCETPNLTINKSTSSLAVTQSASSGRTLETISEGYRAPARRRSQVQSTGEEQEPLLGVDDVADGIPSSPVPDEQDEMDTIPREDENHFEWESEVKGMVSGVVGVAYGEWDFNNRDKTLPQSETSRVIRLLLYVVAVFVLGAPYIIMFLLTGFHAGQSTLNQRSWILAWLVMGQIGGLVSGAWENEYWRVITRLPRLPSATMTRFIISGLIILSMSIGTIGGSIVVGTMIVEDQVCTVV